MKPDPVPLSESASDVSFGALVLTLVFALIAALLWIFR